MDPGLNKVEADTVLQSTLWEAALEEKDAHKAEILKIQKQLDAKSAELLQLLAKHNELTDKVNHLKWRIVAGAINFDDQKSVAGSWGRPVKRAKVTRQCKD